MSEDVFESTLDAALRIARREIFALAVAMYQHSDEDVAIAAARLRYALAYAQEIICSQDLIARSRIDVLILRRLDTVRDAAQALLPQNVSLSPRPDVTSRFIEKLCRLGSRLPSIQADDIRLDRFDLNELPLTRLSLRHAHISRVTAYKAHLHELIATHAKIEHSRFDGAGIRLGDFSDAQVDNTSFEKAHLDGAKWSRAKLSKCAMVNAILCHTHIDDAEFIDCDFRGAQFRAPGEAATSRATFIRCDLRNSSWNGRLLDEVTFTDCKLYGVAGTSMNSGNATFERSDLSAAGDNSHIATKEEVIAHWSSIDADLYLL